MEEFDDLQKTGTGHDRDRQNESEVCGGLPGNTDHNAAEDGGTGTGSSRQAGCNQLEEADNKGILIAQFAETVYICPHIMLLSLILYQKKGNADKDQHDGYDQSIVEMIVQPVIQQDTYNTCRNAGYDGLPPETQGVALPHELSGLFRSAQGPDGFPVHENDGQDGTELDDDKKHLPEGVALFDFANLIQKNHVAGRADRQPFGDSFYDTVEDRF